MELQWAMVMELEKNVPPLEVKLAKERSRAPRHQQSITKAEVRLDTLSCSCPQSNPQSYSGTPLQVYVHP